MSIRHVVYGLLSTDPTVIALVGNRIYDAGALGTPTDKQVPQKPFIVTNYGPDETGRDEDGRVIDRTVDVWFYGNQGDFTIVEKGMRAIKTALHNASGVYVDPDTSEKTWLNLALWQGGSSDLFDDVYRSNCRYGTYRLVGNTP